MFSPIKYWFPCYWHQFAKYDCAHVKSKLQNTKIFFVWNSFFLLKTNHGISYEYFFSLHSIKHCFFFLSPSCFLLHFSFSSGKIDDKNRPKYGSVTNLSVNPEISNKISQARSLFGGSAFSLNKVNDRPLTPYRHASSATDLTNDNLANDKQTISNYKNSNNCKNSEKTSPKPVIKTPIKFTDELQVITQNNEPAKKSTFGHIFKNFFK